MYLELKGGAPSLLHCTYRCTRVVNLRVNANLAYVSWGLQKFRGRDNVAGERLPSTHDAGLDFIFPDDISRLH
jgi:hypothetical protein